MRKMDLFLVLSLFLLSTILQAAQVAKVILLKGTVTEFRPSIGKTIMLDKGSWVSKDSVVETSKSSVIKLLFIDKSRITLGPKSKLAINEYAREKPGVLSLVKGRLRASVLKNALDDGKKNKLYIKTKTAAMGVRGTRFTIINNIKTAKTSVITFAGEVKMAQIPRGAAFKMPTNVLSQSLNASKSVMVRPGQYAGTSSLGSPNIPIKLNPAQFQAMKNSGMFEQTRKVASKSNKYQSKVPPQMDAKVFLNQHSELKESMKEIVGGKALQSIEKLVSNSIDAKKIEGAAPAEGFYNKETGSFAPKAGGFVDIETGAYIVPPPNSEFDPNTNTFIPPSNFGSYDESTGNYTLPEGYVMTESGEVKPSKDPLLGGKTDGPRPEIVTDGGNTNIDDIVVTDVDNVFADSDLPDIESPICFTCNTPPPNITLQNSISKLKITVTVQ